MSARHVRGDCRGVATDFRDRTATARSDAAAWRRGDGTGIHVIRKRASQGSHQQRQRRLFSDDTEYIFLADLAVALACGQTKTGSRYRGECTAKYDRLLHTERELGMQARLAGQAAFDRGA